MENQFYKKYEFMGFLEQDRMVMIFFRNCQRFKFQLERIVFIFFQLEENVDRVNDMFLKKLEEGVVLSRERLKVKLLFRGVIVFFFRMFFGDLVIIEKDFLGVGVVGVVVVFKGKEKNGGV